MDIKLFLDSTYLKTAKEAGVSENENVKLVANCIQEAIDENFKLVMIRPGMVSLAKKMVTNQKSKVAIGTVIDFPKGATLPFIIMMLENASPLPIKAAGGVKNNEEAINLIRLGVNRIGTSAAKRIARYESTIDHY